MKKISEKHIKTLELDKVLAMLSSIAVLSDTKDAALSLRPCVDFSAVNELQNITADAYKLLLRFGAPKFSGAANSSNVLSRAAVGGVLMPSELLSIADTLRVIRIVKEWRENTADIETVLDNYFELLFPNKFLEEKIFRCIISEDEISDAASPLLAEIRRKIRSESSAVRLKLDEVLRSRSKYLQEALITQRDGRYVVPVKAEHRSSVPGLVHDTSASGATLFIEPMSVVESNNELKILFAKENEEINRILAELSADTSGFAETIMRSYSALCELDLAFAKANLAVKLRAGTPKLNTNGVIRLKNARHPLIPAKQVVPVSISLGKEYDSLVITGPNTGGKTVTLKTVGLFCLMAMCGLMIPSDDGSEISVFNDIFVDIGDEQSIEQSLSTFSSHMVNIIEIVNSAGSGSLVLLDELGGGTDPVEGAALAKAILIKLAENGAKIVATTHYAELKSYALDTDRVENASCEFDVETLKPTYRLLIGLPGRSNAFAISKRLGLPDEIVNLAKTHVSEDSLRFERILESLDTMRLATEEKAREAEELRRKLNESNMKASQKLQEVEKRSAGLIESARQKAMDIVERTRAESSRLIGELEDLKKKASAANSAEMLQRARASVKGSLASMTKDADPIISAKNSGYVLPRALVPGDRVLIVDIDKKGDVIALSKDGETVQVSAGIMKTWVKISNLRLIQNERVTVSSGKKVSGIASRAERDAKGELDIRGMAADEALLELDRYLDEAVLAGLSSVLIIHGKGTGVLKKAVRQELKSHKAVRTYRPGVFGEGEDGVTVAELK